MFESLQDGLSTALRSLRGKGKLTEANMREGLGAVQQAMLEADVSFGVVKQFMSRVTEQATGEKVLKALDPSQQVIGIVYQELVNLMGPVDPSLHLRGELPVLMLCGLQGSGKTTTCGKLARMVKQSGHQPLLVAADLQRPAAIDQLHVLGEQIGVPVYSDRGEQDPVKVCRAALKEAQQQGANLVILDTAGRLHIDGELMKQLERIDRQCNPDQVYLVVDAMTGQDAVNSAEAFNDALELDGVIMTKLDGDARGGAALSVKAVTGVPIKLIGTGEQLDGLEPFHPDRMAERILGMGDMRSLVDLAQREFDQEQMARQEQKLREGQFTLSDFRDQMQQIARPGLMQKMMGLMPGMGQMQEMMQGVDGESEIRQLCGIVDSMTPQEREKPEVLDQSRRRRIAAGAGVQPHQVNELVKQYEVMKHAMQQMAGKGMRERMRMAQQMQQEAMSGGKISKQKKGTGKRLSNKEKAKLKKEREREKRRRKRMSQHDN